MNNFLKDITKTENKNNLKVTETVDKSKLDKEEVKQRIEATKKIRQVTGVHNEDERRDYFFSSGVEGWYEELKDHTFKTSFVKLTKKEAKTIKNIFFQKEKADEKVLKSLEKRLDKSIKENHEGKAFIKLSTRSPKDSTAAFKKASEAYHKVDKSKLTENEKYIKFSELMRQGCKVKNGNEAIELLLTSERVAEDFKYYFEGFKETSKDDEDIDILVVVRSFDDEVTAVTEFRGFVWNNKFVCVGQYFHQLYFEDLQNIEKDVTKDLQAFFKSVGPHIKLPCYMMDLVWFGKDSTKKPLLVEVNPFDGESLGAFPASTGLFDWYKDRDIMTGKTGKFVARIRGELPTKDEMKNVNPSWAKLILG